MLFKSVLRTIKKSFGRYLAILAIIALGVGFFSGLRVSESAMKRTADDYLNELNLYDVRLISTLGLTDEDVEAFSQLEGVDKAFGSVSADFIYVTSGGSDSVLHAHTLLDGANGVDLVSGRMPQRPEECVLDNLHSVGSVLGDKIVLSDDNSDDTFDIFAYDEYTVVGLVNSSEYINFERGSTSLGNGSVSGYIYLMPEGFSTDYYTEIYLTMPNREEIYSDEYKAQSESLKSSAEELLRERADLRYNSLLTDGMNEIEDARNELSEKSIELSDAKAEIEDGWQTYNSEKSRIELELADAKDELDKARTELDDSWEKLNAARKDPVSEIPEIASALEEYEAELKNGREEYENGLKELDLQKSEALAKLSESQRELDKAQENIDSSWKEYLDERKSADSELEETKSQLEGAKSELDEMRKNLEASKTSISTPSPLDIMKLQAAGNALDAAEAEYNSNLAQYETAYSLAQEEYAKTESQLESAQAELDSSRAALEAAKEDTENQLTEAEAKLNAAREAIEASQKELDRIKADPIGEMPEIKAQLDDSEKELNEAEQTYAEKLAEYEAARAEAEQGFVDTENELADAQREYDDGLEKIEQARLDIEEAQGEIADLKPASVYSLDRSTNIGYASLENDTAIVSGVAKVFPLFFFLVAALVCITTMTRMVSEKRTENGVLKALGYSDGAIISQFLIYAGSASAVGCILGFLVGSKLMPMALWQVYKIMYAINRPIELVLDWGLFAVCAGMYLLCSLGATWLVCRRDLQENAASLIRPKSPVAGKRILIERVDFIWKHVRFLHKVSIRNILRYKKRMIMMIIGIGGCTALLLTGFGISDSIKPIVDYQYDEITVYDAEVSFVDDAGEDDMVDFEKSSDEVAEDILFLNTQKLDFLTETSDNAPASVNLNVFSEQPDGFIDLHSGDESIAWPEKGEAVINYRLAREFGVKTGDEIILRDSDYNVIKAKVSGIFDNYIYDYVYINADTYAEAVGSSAGINTAFVRFKAGTDVHSATALLLNCKNVSGAFINSDMRSRVGNMLSSLDYIVLIVLVCAGALAFIVLYNLTNITITERSREIATLKVLGFYQNEQNSYVFRENIILTSIASIVGIPMGIALLNYVMAQIKISSMYFGCRLNPLSYVMAVGITFIFTIIVDLALTFKTKGINMAEAMKAIE